MTAPAPSAAAPTAPAPPSLTDQPGAPAGLAAQALATPVAASAPLAAAAGTAATARPVQAPGNPATPAPTAASARQSVEAPPVRPAAAEATAATRSAKAPEAPRQAPDPERAVEIFRQLKLSLTPGTRHAVIQLAPVELGRIAIRVSVKNGRVVGEVRAENAETLDVLERHVPELRAALASSGFEAAEFDFARHGESSSRRDSSFTPLSETGGRLATEEPVRESTQPVHHEGMFDTYA